MGGGSSPPPHPLTSCAVNENAVQNAPQSRSLASEDAAAELSYSPGLQRYRWDPVQLGACVRGRAGRVCVNARTPTGLRAYRCCFCLRGGLFQGRGALQARLMVCERRWRDSHRSVFGHADTRRLTGPGPSLVKQTVSVDPLAEAPITTNTILGQSPLEDSGRTLVCR